MDNWIPIHKNFTSEIHEVMLQQHHAIQFIAMMSQAFVKRKADDSHTNLDYSDSLRAFTGSNISGNSSIFPGIRLKDLRIIFIDASHNIISEIRIVDKTKEEVLIELKEKLKELGMPSERLKDTLHFSIPSHPLDNGSRFISGSEADSEESISYLSNARLVLTQIANRYESSSEIRTWPHHFDTGGIIPLSLNDKGELMSSIGIGFAIPDTLMNEPYFYISHWSADNTEKIADLQRFDGPGQWKIPAWQGAVLGLSELVELPAFTNQYQSVIEFYKHGIDELYLKKHIP